MHLYAALCTLQADINVSCDYSGTPLHNCRRVDVAKRLVTVFKADINAQWENYGTALHLRAKEGDVRVR